MIQYHQHIKCDYLCLYPKGWKTIDKNVLPSIILYDYNTEYDLSRKEFDELCNFKDEGIKLFIVSGVKYNIYIHSSGNNKQILNPEDLVNNVHIVRKEELNSFLDNIDNYNEYKVYNI